MHKKWSKSKCIKSDLNPQYAHFFKLLYDIAWYHWEFSSLLIWHSFCFVSPVLSHFSLIFCLFFESTIFSFFIPHILVTLEKKEICCPHVIFMLSNFLELFRNIYLLADRVERCTGPCFTVKKERQETSKRWKKRWYW